MAAHVPRRTNHSTILAVSCLLGILAPAGWANDPPEAGPSTAPVVAFDSKTVEIKAPKSATGRELADPALAERGVTILLLDAAAIREQAPGYLLDGPAIYLHIRKTKAIVTDVEVIGPDGAQQIDDDRAGWSGDADDGIFRSIPLKQPLDDSMVVRFKVLLAATRKTTIRGLTKLAGKEIRDPVLSAYGMTLEIVDPAGLPDAPPAAIQALVPSLYCRWREFGSASPLSSTRGPRSNRDPTE